MNQMTFEATGWFIGSAVLLVLAVALAVLAKRKSNDMRKFELAMAAAFVSFFAFFFCGLGWYSLFVGLFGGVR